LAAGLRRRCPACGQGRLYESYLEVADRCAVCDLDLSSQDSGDGPAVFIILIVGFVVVGLALLPPLKAWLIALHYRHDLLDQRPGGPDPQG
jgi:uncharacterized protein (DUF983 family)